MGGGLDGLDSPWVWLAIGVVLATAEMLLPGYFLIWLAAAAILTGVVALVVPVSLSIEIVLFVALAINAVLLARRWLRLSPIASADPLLNDRGGRLVGETVVVTQALEGGRGRVRHGDTEWLARGPDTPPGTRLRIVGHDGAVLIVEPLA